MNSKLASSTLSRFQMRTGLYEILSIRHRGGEPGDTYNADLRCIQHVTGFAIFGHLFDPAHQKLCLWWSLRLRAAEDGPPEA